MTTLKPVAGGHLAARRRTAARRAALGTLGIVLFLIIWQAASLGELVNPRYLPPPTTVLAELASLLTQGWFWQSTGLTMLAWGLGLLIASSGALALGLAIGSSQFLRRATVSTIEFLRPIPSVALVPLAVLLFGIRIESALLLIVYAAFWQMLIQVLYGVGDVDMVADATAQSYGLGRLARIRYIVLPSALPYIMTGLRLSATISLILAVTAGLVIGSAGLGREIALAKSSGAVALIYALIVATGVIGLLVNLGMRMIERRVLAWHTSTRAEVIG